MTEDNGKGLIEEAKKRAAILHASAAWGINDDAYLIEGLIGLVDRLTAKNEQLCEAINILEDGLQKVGDDYPGSSCQEWCQHQIKQARAALGETK